MRRIKAVIVDDESRARRVLRNLLDAVVDKVTIVAECENLLDAVAVIKQKKPDVVFLDVEMPQYAGYEIANFFDIIDFEIIFVTAFDNYAVKAFELCAIDYLVKPVDRNRLKSAVEKAVKSLEQNNNLQQYQLLLQSLKNNTLKKIVIPELGNRKVLNLDEILAIEADGAYSKVHLINKKNHIVSKNLKYFEDTSSKISYFYRCHRGWMINTNYLKQLNKSEYTLYLEHDLSVKISRSSLAEIEQKLIENC